MVVNYILQFFTNIVQLELLINLDYCSKNYPCKNGGTCFESINNQFSCSCPRHCKGRRCENCTSGRRAYLSDYGNMQNLLSFCIRKVDVDIEKFHVFVQHDLCLKGGIHRYGCLISRVKIMQLMTAQEIQTLQWNLLTLIQEGDHLM